MKASVPLLPLARWSIVTVIVLMSAALLLTAWATYSNVRTASATLVSGQGHALQKAVRSHLFELGERPTASDLRAILDEEAASGARYLAFVNGSGVVEAEAGSRGAHVHSPVVSGPADEPVWANGRFRVLVRAQPRWPRRREQVAPGGVVVVEFEPLQAEALRASARRTFGVGAISASTLLLIALGLVRWVLGREALERRLEHDKRLASLGQMSAILAHEIRNPLASLKGNAQLLAQSLPATEKSRQKADRVVEEALRLEVLTNDLLEYVRSGTLTKEDISPARLMREAAGRVQPEITIDDSQAPATWLLDSRRMCQVLVNLLENAVQAGLPVKAAVRQVNHKLVFEVSDQGPGVAAGDRERIFEPFHTGRTQGTGLGLAVVKRAVDLHGGTISVENGDRGGAVFRVTLPQS